MGRDVHDVLGRGVRLFAFDSEAELQKLAKSAPGARVFCRVLVDCGQYQERALQPRNWQPLPVDAASLDAVVLTHAHLDHCGCLRRLEREGFRGAVHCTEPTLELVRLLLIDAARLQREDVETKRRRH